jgi:hypothetical protein
MAEAKKAETEAEAPPAKPKGKLILFIAIGVLVLVLIGGGATYFLMKKKAPAEGEDGEDAQTEVKPKKKDKKADHSVAPSFHKFDKAFTVKLQTEQQEAYLQAEVQLRVLDAAGLSLPGRGRCPAQGRHRRVRRARKPATKNADGIRPTTSAARSASCVGACRRWSSSTSASPATCASACSTTCTATRKSRSGRSRCRSTASSSATWWCRPTSTWSFQAAARHRLIVLDPNLVFLVVDNMFGGDGRFHTRVEGRDFTPTEQRIIQGLLNVIFDRVREAWAPVFETEARIHPLGDELPVRQHRHAQRNRRRLTFTLEFSGSHGGNAPLLALLDGRADPRRALQLDAERPPRLGQALDRHPDPPAADRRGGTGGPPRHRARSPCATSST